MSPRAHLAGPVVVLLGVLLGVVLVAGCTTPAGSAAAGAGVSSTPTTATAPATPTAVAPDPAAGRAAAVTDLLERWAAALRRGDADAVAGLADPRADPAFVAAERARAAALAGVPLTDLGYRIGTDPTPVVDPALVRSLAADEVWAPPVELRYALAGADDRPTTRPVGLVVARRGSTWALVSDTAVADRGRTTWRGPWDFGPVITRPGAQGGLVVGHLAQADAVALLGDQLDTAVGAVADFWGGGFDGAVAVWVPGSAAERTALVGSTVDPAGAAVSTADAVDRAAGTATGQRITLDPAVLDRLTPAAAGVLLRHELSHAATRAVTSEGAPRWLLEGVAQHVGYRGTGTTVAAGAPTVAALTVANGPPDQLPDDLQLSTGPGVGIAYELAWTFAEFVADTRGEDVLRALHAAVGVLVTPTEAELDTALRPVLGVGAAQARAQWGAWLAEQVRR